MTQANIVQEPEAETRQVHGYADGFIGSYITGWAKAEPDHGSCLIEIRGESGKMLAAGFATRQRPDLMKLGYGKSNVGFRLLIPDIMENQRLHVMADGIELGNSPLSVGPDLFDGHVHIARDHAIGWVRARTSARTNPRITIRTADGVLVGEGMSTHVIDPNDEHLSRETFNIELSETLFGLEEFVITAHANGVPVATAMGSLPVDGYIDVLSPDCLAGWLTSPAAPARQLSIVVERDGVVVGQAKCKDPRPDLRDKHPAGWRSGFCITLDPPRERATELVPMSIRIKGGVELLGSPFLFGDRFSFVSAARRLAQLSHQIGVDMSAADRAVLQHVLQNYLAARRHGEGYGRVGAFTTGALIHSRPIDILIPIYKGVSVTRACIESALETAGPADRLILVADCPPESEMMVLLEEFRSLSNVVLLVNEVNRGFVGSVNRGLGLCRDDDVLLLNSDTRLFPGGLDEMRRVLHSAPDIGTVTAISNNATIFSYPHPSLASEKLDDIEWAEVAAAVLEHNRGQCIDVPTGHGFCMLVSRDLLNRTGGLNEIFGKGYGEENELCLRGTDLGFRHVAATGAFVEHRESVSFGSDKEALILANLPKLEQMYPEYTRLIMDFERVDPLRVGRWAIDRIRLQRAHEAGMRFVMIAENWLGGGTKRAIDDLGTVVGYDGRTELRLRNLDHGGIELACEALSLQAVFAADEIDALLDVLGAADVELVIFHQLLGFGPELIEALGEWGRDRNAVAYIHDFYALCPRVTLINAIGSYCGVQPSDVCDRCVKLGGDHEASQLRNLSVGEHRELFRRFFANMRAVIAPSQDAVNHFNRAFPDIQARAIPHPEPIRPTERHPVSGTNRTVVLLGGIGPHKGADRLLDLAKLALLSHPHLDFVVIGHTSIDDELEKLPNMTITGRYKPEQLAGLLDEQQASIALFLHIWPETYSYTLSEAIAAGLYPVVPDIGAPAERIRATRFGAIFPFPGELSEVLEIIDRVDIDQIVDSDQLAIFDTLRYAPELDLIFNGEKAAS